MENCIFCKIVTGEIPSDKIYEDEEFLAFLDKTPVNIGHSLVIPKKHFIDISQTPEEIIGGMMKIVKKIAKVVKNEVKADGINIHMNNEKASGQVIFHSHIHVIPRFTNDGLQHWHGKQLYKEGEAKELVRKIIQAL